MILDIAVENIAIIDNVSLSLGSGFTALTGETGAGKSLVIDAISLALGGRADSDLVRTGARKASVTLLADLRANPFALAKCAEHGIEPEDGQLVIQREVSAEGRSTVRLNGKPAAVGTLREIGALLVDMHGQHDHQSLLHPERQIEFLDAWIGEPCSKLVSEVGELYSQVEALKRKLHHLRTGQREREQRLDMLRFQIEEIQAAAPTPGETEELENRLNRLSHAERLGTGVQGILAANVDEEGSALERLTSAVRELSVLSALDPSLSELLEPIENAEIQLRDGLRDLRHYADSLEHDPVALEETGARLDLLSKLKRKYGDTEEQILEFLENAIQELAELEGIESDEGQLEMDLKIHSDALRQKADSLTDLRVAKAKEFQATVQEHIRDLAMDSAVFEVSCEKIDIQPNGQDQIVFYFSANSGETPRPLSKVASGGELSRVMLSIKAASAGRAGVPTLVFDEVDAGLGGRAAAVTAKKLQSLAQQYQVIVISHLPQIAGKATTHFRIEKVEQQGRVRTQVIELSTEERVEEIARMLAGENVGESAIANARELLV
ncbi:DNA repair protein RecN [Kamptonema cortianum]|nr:DNA repair protein RecN [Geitlerinema splendidum]MDK3162456.1 DNA repair protein RecN [Kamptonema cortianum]